MTSTVYLLIQLLNSTGYRAKVYLYCHGCHLESVDRTTASLKARRLCNFQFCESKVQVILMRIKCDFVGTEEMT